MRGADRGDRQEFQREIAVGDGVDGVAGRLAEAERLRRHVAVNGVAGAGKSGSTDRAFIQMLDGVAHAGAVTAEHFHIGHAMMAEGDGLGCLQMGEAGHDRIGIFFGAIEEGGDERGQHALGLLQFFLHPQAEIERHLVVARAGGVQAAGCRADERCEPRFDVHMNIFELARKLEAAGFDL
ncbi:hypothetical protein D3C80_373620 [compost metagenome]